MPDVGREREFREWLPQWAREKAIGQSAKSLHARKDHPAESQGPCLSSETVVQRIGQYSQLGTFELLVRIHGEHASGHRYQADQPTSPDPEAMQLKGSTTRPMQKVSKDGAGKPGLAMQMSCKVEPTLRIRIG